jgi:hypothetical protein
MFQQVVSHVFWRHRDENLRTVLDKRFAALIGLPLLRLRTLCLSPQCLLVALLTVV